MSRSECLSGFAGFLSSAVLGVVFSFTAPASADQYTYSCGSTAAVCKIEPHYKADGVTEDVEAKTLISHGDGNTTEYVILQGVPEFRCGEGHGDIAPGKSKTCQATSFTLPDPGGWVDCANSGERCSFTPVTNGFRIVRYGKDNRWVYAYTAGPDVWCTPNGGFNGIRYDVWQNQTKKCQISKNTIRGAMKLGEGGPLPATWRICAAAEGAECVFPRLGSYLVRYGVNDINDGAMYRYVTGDKMTCSEQVFGFNPKTGQVKNCKYLELSEIAKVSGRWELVGSCPTCGSVQYATESGVERGKTKERESSFGLEVSATASYTSGATTNAIAQTSVSTTITASANVREMVAHSFTQSEKTQLTIACDKGSLWQWVTRVDNVCLPGGNSGDCVTVARAKLFKCLGPNDSPGPNPS